MHNFKGLKLNGFSIGNVLENFKALYFFHNGLIERESTNSGMEYWTGLLEWLKLIVRYM